MKITVTDKVYITENITVNTTTTINVNHNAYYNSDDTINAIIETVNRIDRKNRKSE